MNQVVDDVVTSACRPPCGSALQLGGRADEDWNVAAPHKHPAGAHAYVISGKLQVRNGTLSAGDYVYEPSGILHDATTALEDTTYLFICNGAVLYFDENSFTRYLNWEVVEKMRTQAVAPVRAAAE